MTISKSDYLLWRDCPKNAWMKVHRPAVFYASELSDFEKAIIETGNEVEIVARRLFPDGFLVEGRDERAEEATRELVARGEKAMFQPIFRTEGLLAAVDVLEYDEKAKGWNVYEIKASNDVKDDWHPYDLAFQMRLLRKCGLDVKKGHIIHLNSEYVRQGELEIPALFSIRDITSAAEAIIETLETEIAVAREFLEREDEPKFCSCLYKTRSNHCATFGHSNPHVPAYGVHDISRIGKKGLTELVDSGIFLFEDIPEDFKLTENQRNQVELARRDRPLVRREAIAAELEKLAYPLYFLDYETYPSALPRFDGFSTYQQIPFQYSLHIVESPGAEPIHREFLYTGSDDPSHAFAASLRENIGDAGTVVVWYKPFECGRNRELGERLPHHRPFLSSIEERVYDLRDIFTGQHYVHKDFKGKTSIKYVLPVLAPGFSYKSLAIQEGGTASQKWNEMVTADLAEELKAEVVKNLREYCKLDTYAMYAIWKHLSELV